MSELQQRQLEMLDAMTQIEAHMESFSAEDTQPPSKRTKSGKGIIEQR